MVPIDALNYEQKEAIEKLRLRMKNNVPPEMYDDTLTFYRFLKARDFDIDKAEIMLEKFITWKKAFQLDAKVENFEFSEVFRKYITPSIIGYEKLGNVIAYVPAGRLDMGNILKCIKMSDYMTHLTVFGERILATMVKDNEKVGKYPYQGILILDLEKLTLANAANRSSAELFLRISQLLQDTYPERLKSCFIINAPAYYVLVYSIVRRFMSKELAQKVGVFGKTGWKEELLKIIDAEVLPAFLGGKRTDPDGNPLCLNSVIHGTKIPSKYFLTNEQRWFKDPSQVNKIVVFAMEKSKIPVKVTESGSLIEWEFESKNRDIAFGLFFQDLEKEIEVLPIQRFITFDGTETGSYKTQWKGTYIVIFDNSYSWMSSKEVRYCVTVSKPKRI